MRRTALLSLAALAGALAATGAMAVQSRGLAALSTLQKGMWQIRDLDNPGARPIRLCLGDARRLFNLHHRGLNCSVTVISDGPQDVTVRYTCPAEGFGQTDIHVETPRLARISSQGLLRGVPFALNGQARRIGSC
ncbi:MAG: DUF3617 domain-containing protein [Sphingomonadaceae bacterium]